MRILILTVLLIVANCVWATEDSYEFETTEQRELFLSLTAELRCPMCQNQNIADSDAMIAHDMRRKVYSLIKQGKSNDEVITYMKSRYGDFIHYQPPVTPVTVWLWVTPLLFAALAIGVVVWRRKSMPPQDMQSKLAAAEKMLEQNK